MIYKYKNFTTKYDVGIDGSVRNIETDHYLKGHLNKKTGYKSIYLYLPGGKRKRVNIHRMVMDTYNPCNDPTKVIDHINGNKQDNRLINLQWLTIQQNTLKSAREKQNCQIIYQYSLEGELLNEYYSINEAARQNGINRVWLSRMLTKYNGLTKSSNFLWSYNKI